MSDQRDKPIAEQECQICDDKSVVVCLDGALWLCWTCYVAEIKRRSTDIAARDREREDALLKRFEDLAGKWKLIPIPEKNPRPDYPVDSSEWARLVIKNRHYDADEIISLTASIRKDRE